MKHKFTEGEWRHAEGSIYSETHPSGADIATVNTNTAHFTQEEIDANGDLLAAAPKLLRISSSMYSILSVLAQKQKDGIDLGIKTDLYKMLTEIDPVIKPLQQL